MDNPKTETDSDDSYSGPEFDLPAGYAPPEEVAEGEETTVLAKIRMKGPNRACLVSLDGAEFGKEPEKVEAPEVVTEEVESQSTEGESFGDRLRNVRKSQMS